MGLPGKILVVRASAQGSYLCQVPPQPLNPRALRKFHLPQAPSQIHWLESQAQGPPPLTALVLLLGQSHSLAWEEEEEEERPIYQRAEGGLRARTSDLGCPYLSPMSRRVSV